MDFAAKRLNALRVSRDMTTPVAAPAEPDQGQRFGPDRIEVADQLLKFGWRHRKSSRNPPAEPGQFAEPFKGPRHYFTGGNAMIQAAGGHRPYL
jgi:hypothetical protein